MMGALILVLRGTSRFGPHLFNLSIAAAQGVDSEC